MDPGEIQEKTDFVYLPNNATFVRRIPYKIGIVPMPPFELLYGDITVLKARGCKGFSLLMVVPRKCQILLLSRWFLLVDVCELPDGAGV
jgi:hypothetical protein